jgi:hypothetical protein
VRRYAPADSQADGGIKESIGLERRADRTGERLVVRDPGEPYLPRPGTQAGQVEVDEWQAPAPDPNRLEEPITQGKAPVAWV